MGTKQLHLYEKINTFYSSLLNFFFLKFRIIKFMKMSVNNPKDEYLISQHIVKIQQYISSRL